MINYLRGSLLICHGGKFLKIIRKFPNFPLWQSEVFAKSNSKGGRQ
jgi:hypothetical protein